MSLTALHYKNQGNQHYANHQSALAVQAYSQAIQLLHGSPHEDHGVALHLLYSNRSAAHIQDKDFYNGYEDAKQSLTLKREANVKGFYRATVCAYHLGFLDEAERLMKEATNEQTQNADDYREVKMLIEKKEKCMKRWRKPVATAKKTLKNLEHMIEKGVLWFEMPAMLYQIRYSLRAYFEKTKDRKLMNMDHGNLGLRLHELAVQFNALYPVEKILLSDPIFEDLILNEMPDVGTLRLKASEQRTLPRDQRDYDLEETSGEDLTAYEFSFFVNNVLASLVANASDEKISLRALRQLHRFTTIDLYRQALGDALSDAINNYIYRNYQNISLVEHFLGNSGVEILFYDYVEAACKLSASRMIKQITIGHWKKQLPSTVQLAIKQISATIRQEGIELIEPRESSSFSTELKRMMAGLHSTDHRDEDERKDFNLLVNVLTKIYFVFGQSPFVERALRDPFFLYAERMWFAQITDEEKQRDIPFLLNGWTTILTQWLKLDYQKRRIYFEQINPELLYADDED